MVWKWSMHIYAWVIYLFTYSALVLCISWWVSGRSNNWKWRSGFTGIELSDAFDRVHANWCPQPLTGALQLTQRWWQVAVYFQLSWHWGAFCVILGHSWITCLITLCSAIWPLDNKLFHKIVQAMKGMELINPMKGCRFGFPAGHHCLPCNSKIYLRIDTLATELPHFQRHYLVVLQIQGELRNWKYCDVISDCSLFASQKLKQTGSLSH